MKPFFWYASCGLLFATSALGCSTEPGYRAPTNIELIERADLVILARVISASASKEDGTVQLRPLSVMKGSSPRRLSVIGGTHDESGKPYAPTPTGLNEPHPSTRWGACIRQAYAPGALVIAMFSKTPAGYRQLNFSFARSIEDVEGPNAVWVQAARLYTQALRQKNRTARRHALLQQQRRLERLWFNPTARAITGDIAHHLRVTRNR